MQTIFRKATAAAAVLMAGLCGPAEVLAHPGHAPTDLAAQVSAPFAGPDHVVAFIVLSAVLLTAVWRLRKARSTRRTHS
jgi:hydrogenase/urease accessory protein HupE